MRRAIRAPFAAIALYLQQSPLDLDDRDTPVDPNKYLSN